MPSPLPVPDGLLGREVFEVGLMVMVVRRLFIAVGLRLVLLLLMVLMVMMVVEVWLPKCGVNVKGSVARGGGI